MNWYLSNLKIFRNIFVRLLILIDCILDLINSCMSQTLVLFHNICCHFNLMIQNLFWKYTWWKVDFWYKKGHLKNVNAYKSKLNTWKEYSMKAKHNFVRRTSLEKFDSYKIKVIFHPFQIGCLFSFALMLWIFPSRLCFFQFVSFVA